MWQRWAAWAAWAALAAGTLLGAAAADDVPRPEHPRPDFRRETWLNLNGPWQFGFDADDRGMAENWHATDAATARFDRQIVVPFCWESKLSGVGDASGQKIGWYRRTVRVPDEFRGRRVWLCFGAVDWEARVWVNGRELGVHEGGYTPFAFDITPHAPPGSEATIVVRAMDATDPELPLGKQVPRWYTSTSGIWQTVYLEARPERYVERLRLTPVRQGAGWALDVELEAAGPDATADAELVSPQGAFATQRATLRLDRGRGRLRTLLEIDSPRLWTPDDPHLYDLLVRVRGAEGSIDEVHTYFGLRTIGRGPYGDLPHESILLNGEPIYLRGALDQSFNPEGIYTAPGDELFRRDMEIAKEAGFNLLRIHIKADEPRRLYWADRLGVLILQDMPCTWAHSPRAQQAWEQTMRATIERDRNHPAIVGWCLFNETWGLGRDYAANRQTQDWVLGMWGLVKRELDPSRPVEDNSPCRYDHVRTDLNSWHFYIDDYRRAREHIEEAVRNTRPGSPWNFVPGRTQDTAPLLNSEYGAVGARGGDRDVSWGFRYLTTQLRRHDLIQGYVYTELTDIEWEHNGVANYDRSAKEFGYEAFVPGMTVADLQGADFVGFDAPPVLEALPGEERTLPLFVSHFSRRSRPPVLQWRIEGVDSQGRQVAAEPQRRQAAWRPYRVTYQEPLRVRMPSGRPFVGALAVELLDENRQRIAANFVNLIVRPQPKASPEDPRQIVVAAEPRVEVLGPRQVLLRFEPGDVAAVESDATDEPWKLVPGKLSAYGSCEVVYRVAVPKFVRDALPTHVVWTAEMAAKADRQRLDWPERRSALDYPQTQERKFPSTVSVRLLEEELWRLELPDDPADARGVLSHHAGYEHGSYGYLVRQKADLTRHVALREALGEKEWVPLVFRSENGRGLAIYGRQLGRYPVDPMLLIETARDLAQPVGWVSDEAATIDRLPELPKPEP